MRRPPPKSTLFPYTTLFRSRLTILDETGSTVRDAHWKDDVTAWLQRDLGDLTYRSEEHTSELQSRRDLVCRLLLEKKKNNDIAVNTPSNSSALQFGNAHEVG